MILAKVELNTFALLNRFISFSLSKFSGNIYIASNTPQASSTDFTVEKTTERRPFCSLSLHTRGFLAMY